MSVCTTEPAVSFSTVSRSKDYFPAMAQRLRALEPLRVASLEGPLRRSRHPSWRRHHRPIRCASPGYCPSLASRSIQSFARCSSAPAFCGVTHAGWNARSTGFARLAGRPSTPSARNASGRRPQTLRYRWDPRSRQRRTDCRSGHGRRPGRRRIHSGRSGSGRSGYQTIRGDAGPVHFKQAFIRSGSTRSMSVYCPPVALLSSLRKPDRHGRRGVGFAQPERRQRHQASRA